MLAHPIFFLNSACVMNSIRITHHGAQHYNEGKLSYLYIIYG
jgi:hypothetical protein